MGCCSDSEVIEDKRKIESTTIKENNVTQKKETKQNQIKYRDIDINKKRENKIDKKKHKDILKIENQKRNQSFAERALKKNNEIRDLHGVEPLELDEYLKNNAFILAQQILNEGSIQSYNLMNYKEGEELGYLCLQTEEELDGDDLMNKWYNEKGKYNFQEPENSTKDNSDFTQMIWKSSKKFGIGYFYLQEEIEDNRNEKNDNDKNEEVNNEPEMINHYCYVALYYPAGNIPGEFKKNVLKEKPKPPEPSTKEILNNQNTENIYTIRRNESNQAENLEERGQKVEEIDEKGPKYGINSPNKKKEGNDETVSPNNNSGINENQD